jgi:thiamine-phosphate pyrophosphorylase
LAQSKRNMLLGAFGAVRQKKCRALQRLYLLDARSNPDYAHVLKRLPVGTGVVVRAHTAHKRQRLAAQLRPLCQRYRLILLVAGTPLEALRARAQGVHLNAQATQKRLKFKRYKKRWWVSAAAHTRAELHAARQAGAQSVCLSPILATASHPEAKPLGIVRFGLVARTSRLPVLALGGITRQTIRQLSGLKIYGFAGISFWEAGL